MAGIRIEFSQFGHFDYFEIIRSDTSMIGVADSALPAPIATNLKTMYYVDTAVVEGATYYYKIRVHRSGLSAVSATEIEALAILGDEYFNYVELLFLTDGEVKDYSNLNRTPSVTGTYAFIPSTTIPVKYDEYSYDISDYGALNFGQITLGLDDFTFESYVYSPGDSYLGTLFFLNGCGFEFSVANGSSFMVRNSDYSFYKWVSVSVPRNQWNHWCVMRKDGVFYAYLNGVQKFSYSNTFNMTESTIRLFSDGPRNGTMRSDYMSSTRLTRFARYETVGFTPPSEKFRTM